MKLTLLILAALLYPISAFAQDIHVKTAAELQPALDKVTPGNAVILDAGSRFVGQFKLPAKAGMVTLRSLGTLPDRRVSELDAPLMGTIASGVGAMPIDLANSRNWTIDGVRFENNTGGEGDIIWIQMGENIVLRRLLLVVPHDQQQKRFVLGNGKNITLTQSHCAGVWRTGQDSQCFVAWDGAGPYKITDNYLEAASENVMFGGADSSSEANIPADILVERNHFSKPLRWKNDGVHQVIKNLFELKAARRVIVRHNIFERNWGGEGQDGHSILFTPRNQDGKAPWSGVEDVLFERNIVRDVTAVFNILGYDDLQPSRQTTGIVIRHNLLIGNGGRMALIHNEVGTLTFDHNTYLQPQTGEAALIGIYTGGKIALAGGTSRTATYAAESLTVTNNILQHNTYGVHGSTGMGTAALAGTTKSYVWAGNTLIGGSASGYPAGTKVITAAEAPSHLGPDHLLLASSSLKGTAAGGTDPGWHGTDVVVPPPPPPDPEPDPEPEPPAPPPPPPAGRDTIPPTGSMTVVQVGRSANYTVTVSAADDVAVTRVDVFVNDKHVTMLTTPTTGATTFTSRVKLFGSGSFAVKAVAYDYAGNSTALKEAVKR